jgi:hypothetical protein
MTVSSSVPKVIQQLLTSSSSSSCHFYPPLYLSFNNVLVIRQWKKPVLRKIEGKTRRDRISNKIIRETVGVQSIQEYVERSQLRLYGHVNRMYDKRIVKRVYEAREIGKKPRGRPRKTWKEGLRVTRSDKKERSNMQRGGKDSKG